MHHIKPKEEMQVVTSVIGSWTESRNRVLEQKRRRKTLAELTKFEIEGR